MSNLEFAKTLHTTCHPFVVIQPAWQWCIQTQLWTTEFFIDSRYKHHCEHSQLLTTPYWLQLHSRHIHKCYNICQYDTLWAPSHLSTNWFYTGTLQSIIEVLGTILPLAHILTEHCSLQNAGVWPLHVWITVLDKCIIVYASLYFNEI